MKSKTKEITPSPGINKTGRTRFVAIFGWPLLIGLLTLPQMMQAQWTATVGSQTDDKAIAALAFLPDEIWIHAGDRITWTFEADEPHTVTFLTAGQVRPDPAVGCPGFSTDPATFNGSTCVTTPLMVTGQTFTVIFPVAGNFKLTCLMHVNMDGRIHVLPAGEPLPHTQAFYDNQAASQSDEFPMAKRTCMGLTESLTHHWESRRGSQRSQERRAAPAPSWVCAFPTRISKSMQVKRSNGITRVHSSRIPLPSGPSRWTSGILPPT